jgi:hypothetical protein
MLLPKKEFSERGALQFFGLLQYHGLSGTYFETDPNFRIADEALGRPFFAGLVLTKGARWVNVHNSRAGNGACDGSDREQKESATCERH